MAAWRVANTFALALLVSAMIPTTVLEAKLSKKFYRKSCPDVERIIQSGVEEAFERDKHTAAGLLRLHFHDCFVNGCDGSVLIDSANGVTAEKDGRGNANSLRGFETIDGIKSHLEDACPGVVSCADILAYATRDSVVLAGGPSWHVEAGRRDGTRSSSDDLRDNLPGVATNVVNLTASFAKKGLSQDDMVTLSGGHTLGQSHCVAFATRIDPGNPDPILDSTYAAQLAQVCPAPTPGDVLVDLDPTATVFDTRYFAELLVNRGLLTSDQVLAEDPATRGAVERYAHDRARFCKKFAKAMVRMGRIEVLTGSQGEVRLNCRVVNS